MNKTKCKKCNESKFYDYEKRVYCVNCDTEVLQWESNHKFKYTTEQL